MSQRPVIVGAGPGGAATALRLSYLGQACILIDKATFPRDKICGDAISGKVTTLLNRLDPAILRRFEAQAEQIDVWGVRFLSPNRRALDIPFKPGYNKAEESIPGYVSKRMSFDNFLMEEVRRRPDIEVLEGVEIDSIVRTEGGYELTDKLGTRTWRTPLLLMANGAHSRFTRLQAGLQLDKQHHAAAVRAYYRGVEGLHADNFIELHFLREITPGYFWIFPLPNGQVNVGLGMRSDIIARRQVNLRRMFDHILREHPQIAPRFAQAQAVGSVRGYGLPLGSKTRRLSGDHYLLIGDAGHLIDPLTGEGIGNAVYSGFIAAELAIKAYAQNDFSASYLADYDVRVQRVLGSEMRLSYQMQRLAMYPRAVNLVANMIASNRKVLDYLSGMYTDFNLREQMVNPLFWLRMWMKKDKAPEASATSSSEGT